MSTQIIEINHSCDMCSESFTSKIESPNEWHCGDTVDVDSDVFCPKHKEIRAFKSAQCPGCVASWKDCGLWKAFAHGKYSTGISMDQRKHIASGICPFRVNGTMSFSARGLKSIDLSDKAQESSGIALLAAIDDYIKKYPIIQ